MVIKEEIVTETPITFQDPFFRGDFKKPYSLLKESGLSDVLFKEEFLEMLKSVVRREEKNNEYPVARLRHLYMVSEDYVKTKVGEETYKKFLDYLDKEGLREARHSILAYATLKEMQKRNYYPRVILQEIYRAKPAPVV